MTQQHIRCNPAADFAQRIMPATQRLCSQVQQFGSQSDPCRGQIDARALKRVHLPRARGECPFVCAAVTLRGRFKAGIEGL